MGFQPLERSDRGILGIGVAMFSQLDIAPMAAYGWASSVRVPFAPAFLAQARGHHYTLSLWKPFCSYLSMGQGNSNICGVSTKCRPCSGSEEAKIYKTRCIKLTHKELRVRGQRDTRSTSIIQENRFNVREVFRARWVFEGAPSSALAGRRMCEGMGISSGFLQQGPLG